MDDTITVDIVFDQAYENATVQFHADADNDSFKGTADLVEELGAVEAGDPYTVTVSTETSSWAVSGQFLHVNSTSLSLDPQLTQETIQITVLDGETDLTSAQSDPAE